MPRLIKITTKFRSQCSRSLNSIPVGTDVWFDPQKKKVYLPGHQPAEVPEMKTGDQTKDLLDEQKKEWYLKVVEIQAKPPVQEVTGFEGTITKQHLGCGCRRITIRFGGKWRRDEEKSIKSDQFLFCDQHSIVNLELQKAKS